MMHKHILTYISTHLTTCSDIHARRYEVERDHYNADGEELRRLLAVRCVHVCVYVCEICVYPSSSAASLPLHYCPAV